MLELPAREHLSPGIAEVAKPQAEVAELRKLLGVDERFRTARAGRGVEVQRFQLTWFPAIEQLLDTQRTDIDVQAPQASESLGGEQLRYVVGHLPVGLLQHVELSRRACKLVEDVAGCLQVRKL